MRPRAISVCFLLPCLFYLRFHFLLNVCLTNEICVSSGEESEHECPITHACRSDAVFAFFSQTNDLICLFLFLFLCKNTSMSFGSMYLAFSLSDAGYKSVVT